MDRKTTKENKLLIKSIIQKDTTRCYLCGRQYGLECHHIFGGVANRKLSTKFKLVVMLCARCHRGTEGAQYESSLNTELKQEAQKAFEEQYSHDDWMKIFKKNYL